METICRFRAMASLCRQTSAHYPDRRWKLLAEAEFWDHLADDILRGGLEQFRAGGSLPAIGEDPEYRGTARVQARLKSSRPPP